MTDHQTSSSDDTPSSPAAHRLAFDELHDVPTGTRPVLDAGSNPLHHIKTQLQVCIGQVELTVGDLVAAKEHQVFKLDRQVEEPVDLLLGGKLVARGQLVAVEDHFAVRITDIPVPLKP